MADPLLQRIPVVGGLGYIERVRELPETFSATLAAEPENRYLPNAIAVLVGGHKIGYVAPEIAREYYDVVRGASAALTCPGRRASPPDHATSGVESLLDFSALPNG